MKLSILIPTYNYANYLPQALQSILEQDFHDFELLISDDASSDNTHVVVQPFLERDTRIRYIRQPKNLGMVANWNWCLHQAQGDYVYYLFADDFLLGTNALSTLVTALDAHPAAAMAVSPRLVVDEAGQARRKADDMGAAACYSGLESMQRCWLGGGNLIGEPSAVMLRKGVTSRGFDPRFKQMVDLEMWMYCLTQGDLVLVAHPHVAFRQHPQQQTVANRSDPDTLLEMHDLFQRYQTELQPHGTWIKQLHHYRMLYRIRYDIQRAALNAPEIETALSTLHAAIPLRWQGLARIAYRLQKLSTSVRRAWQKRRALPQH